MACHHLGYSYCAPPAYVAGVSDLQLPELAIMQATEAKKRLHLLDVPLQEWLKICPVAEVKQAVESILELLLRLSDFLRLVSANRSLGQAEDSMK